MNLIEIFSIIFIHWVADFVFQTHNDAINKSSNNWNLTSHIATYSSTWAVIGIILTFVIDITLSQVAYFVIISFICHWITDWFTSRWAKKYFSKQDYHNGFVVVGFDQILHYVQLFTTYWLLKW